MAYDLIGDIHGCADELAALLKKLGYEERNGAYRHPERQVLFSGDFIDRGKQNRQVLSMVRSMVEAGSAMATLGNHEYNAICYHSRHPETDEYLRPHNDKNTKQHQSFLDEYSHDPEGLKDVIEWFLQLPLYLDLGRVRVVHACWHTGEVEKLEKEYQGKRLTPDLLLASAQEETQEWRIIETLLKGPEEDLPENISFLDKDEHERTEIRTRWWHPEVRTYREAALLSDEELQKIPEDVFPAEKIIGYAVDAPPVFFGHYWLSGNPSVFRNNVACLDYSVAKGGALCCYRWSGERQLSNANFVSVPGK